MPLRKKKTSRLKKKRPFIIDRNHMNDIVMVVEDEIIYNTFDAIWCTYCHILSIINDTSNPNRDEEWTKLISAYLHHLITHFNKSNKHSSLMLR